MKKLVLIDGNSIMNRAFYGIMGSKMLTTKDGKYTNAVYGFLAIMFKILDDINPEYLAVAFDMKGKLKRKELFDGYKANRHGMPDELAEQMPLIKEILKAMNIDIIEKEGYEGDDILGTLAKYGEKQGLEVTILSGDRDTFQLASDNITIRIPRTKGGKTETEDYNRAKVLEEYGIEPKQLIEVKALQGDSSDNIPGVPGVGPKTAISLIKKYHSVENLYDKIEAGEDDLKGKQKENITNNKEMAMLSRTLGEIDTNVPLEDTLEDIKVEEWDKTKVLEIFDELRFNRYIERFKLKGKATENQNVQVKHFDIVETSEIPNVTKLYYFLQTEEYDNTEFIIKRKITGISIYSDNKIYYIVEHEGFEQQLKKLFENEQIEKYGYDLAQDYILLKQIGITMKNIAYDAKIAAYILNPTSKYTIDVIARDYLEIDNGEYLQSKGVNQEAEQTSLFETQQPQIDNSKKIENSLYTEEIYKLAKVTMKKLEEINAIDLFRNIDMPTVEVLAEMQWNGMYVDLQELEDY